MIEWIISSSVLIAVVIALRYILRGRISLRLQYALWGLVLLRLLIPFSIGSSGLSLMNTLEKASVVQDVMSISGVETIERTEEGTVQGFISSGNSLDFPTVVAEHKTEQEFARMKTVLTFREVLKPLWLCGIAVLLVVFAAANGRFAYRLRRTRKTLEFKGALLPVYITNAVETPCLFGLFSPAIYIPPLAAENATVLRHTVEHETTHYRHGDNLWAILRGICLALHWYNPLVWWAAILSRCDAELACDEATIQLIGENERAEYGRTLLAMTCQKRPALLVTATTMMGSKRGIRERITLIVKKPKMAVYTLIVVVLIAAIAVGCTFTGAKGSALNAEKPEPATSNTGSGSDALSISVEVQGNIPTAVLEFAQDYVSQTVSAWNGDADKDPGTTITQAKITGLTRINTGTAGLTYGQDLWLLEYRLLPEDPDSVTLAEGMQMELIDGQNWLTERNSSGQPCLLLYYEDDGDLTVWERVCATYTGVIEQDFGTPGMLEQYGNAYTAAAMELYASYLEQNGSAGKSAAAALDASLSQLILDYYRDYDQQRVYFQGDEPGAPREGDCRIESVTYLGGTRLYEVMGLAYEVSRSSYGMHNGELGWQVWQPTILIVTRGSDGICDRVLGSTDNTGDMALNDIIRQVSWGLSDLDVALWRDGYPNPAGPGTKVPFYNAAYDGPVTIEVLENAEPVYNEGDYWAQHSWAGFEALCYHSAAGDVYSVYAINTTRTDLSTYREIRVGDSREAVLAAYPELKSGEYWNNYPGNYWETQPGEDCMWYCDDPKNLGPALLFFFKGGKVSRIVLNHLVD